MPGDGGRKGREILPLENLSGVPAVAQWVKNLPWDP